jgi:hypothetical protein
MKRSLGKTTPCRPHMVRRAPRFEGRAERDNGAEIADDTANLRPDASPERRIRQVGCGQPMDVPISDGAD